MNMYGFETKQFIPCDPLPGPPWHFDRMPRYLCERSRPYFARKVGLPTNATTAEIEAAFKRRSLEMLLECDDTPAGLRERMGREDFGIGILIRDVDEGEHVERLIDVLPTGGRWHEVPVGKNAPRGTLVFSRLSEHRYRGVASAVLQIMERQPIHFPADAVAWLTRERPPRMPDYGLLGALDAWSMDAVRMVFRSG